MSKLTTKEMNTLLANAMAEVPVLTKWKHYKGGVYEISDHSISTTNGEVLVQYFRIDGPDFDKFEEGDIAFSRPLNEWFDLVKDENGDEAILFHRVTKRSYTEWVPRGEV